MKPSQEPPLVATKDGHVLNIHESLSPRRIRIEFRDLEYLLPSNVKRGTISTVLHRMSGYFNAGEMTAIMGPSGCGKSMMMDVMAGRRSRGKVMGRITYAGIKPSKMLLRRITGYVEQFETLVENLTVFELLMYTIELKRPMSESYASKKKAVNDLISRLALEKCRDTKIGNPQLDRGISGGQAKRVNLGIALITNPRVLYMDEPISGLDSYTSNEIMGLVKNFTGDGMTIVATLHSPTPYVFNLFQNVCLLLRGHVVYFGKRTDAIPFFKPITSGTTVSADRDAEWLTDVIVKADATGNAEKCWQFFDRSKRKQEIIEELDASNKCPKPAEDVSKEIFSASAMVTPDWFAVMTYLKYRTVKNYMDSHFWVARISDKVVLCILIATVYRGLGDIFTFHNFTNIVAVFLIWSAFSGFGAAIYIPTFFIDRQLFYRERRDGLYRVSTYFCVRVIEELLFMTGFGLICCVAVWFAVQFKGSFLMFYLIFMGNFCCGLALAFFFSMVAPNIDAAVGGISTYMTTVTMFCGFFIRAADMSKVVRWYSKISFIRYSFGAFLMNHYDCSEGSDKCVWIHDAASGARVAALEYYGLNDHTAAGYCRYLYLFAVGFFILAFLSMKYIRHGRN